MNGRQSNNPLRSDYTGDQAPISRPAKLMVGGGGVLVAGLVIAAADPFGVLVAVVGGLMVLAGLVGYSTGD